MAEMSDADQVRGALTGLLAAGVEPREAVELIENIPSWMETWEYSVDMDSNVEIIDLVERPYGACEVASEHLPRQDHRWQECPVYHAEEE